MSADDFYARSRRILAAQRGKPADSPDIFDDINPVEAGAILHYKRGTVYNLISGRKPRLRAERDSRGVTISIAELEKFYRYDPKVGIERGCRV